MVTWSRWSNELSILSWRKHLNNIKWNEDGDVERVWWEYPRLDGLIGASTTLMCKFDRAYTSTNEPNQSKVQIASFNQMGNKILVEKLENKIYNISKTYLEANHMQKQRNKVHDKIGNKIREFWKVGN